MGGDTPIGRDRELAVLRELADRAVAGSPVVALIAGDAGIGKSTLLASFAAQAAPIRLVTGSASESGGAPAFWPWRQALQLLATESGDSGLSRLVEETGGGTARSEDRFATFAAVVDAVAAATAQQPVLVLLDDLHWADAGSIMLLTHLARELRTGRIMIVGALRAAELTARRHGAELVSAVARHHDGAYVELVGFDAADIDRQLTALLGREPGPGVVADMQRRTGGNPLFVRELGRLLRAGDASGAPAPIAVRDAVRQHLSALDVEARDLLAAAAVAGMELDPAFLAAVTGHDPATVLEQLDTARRIGVLEGTTPVQRHRFTHDLFRECLVLDLPVSRAGAFHLAIAEQLEKSSGADVDAGVAHHRAAALPLGDHVEAATAARRAGTIALGRLAFEDAAVAFDRGLAADLPAALRIPLLLDAAKAHHLAQDVPATMQRCTEVVELATRLDDAESIAAAALIAPERTDPEWDPLVATWCAEALRRLPAGETPLRARLVARQTLAGAFVADAGSLDRDSAQALAMAERVDDDSALVTALRARQIARSDADGNAERVHLGRRMIDLGARTSATDSVFWGRMWCFEALVQAGRIDEAEAELAALGAQPDAQRAPLHRWHLNRARCAVLTSKGRFAAALRLAQDPTSDDPAEPTFARSMRVIGPLLEIAVLTGDTGFDPRPQLTPTGPTGVPAYGYRIAQWHLAFGRVDEAAEIHDRMTAVPVHITPFLALMSSAHAGAVAAGVGDADRARQAYRELLPYQHLHVATGAGITVLFGSVHHFLGVTAAAIGRVPEAVEHFAAACRSNDAAGLLPYACRSRLRLAEVLAQRDRAGDRDRARTVLDECLPTARRLGMPLVVDAAEGLVRALDGSAEPALLSARQQQVAELVAAGHSNRRIADQLHISVRTAENHVQAILTALGLRNRTQIATWVTERVRQ